MCLKTNQVVDEELRQYVPAFRYLLIDTHGMNKEWLAGLKSAAAYFFLLDKTNLDDVEAPISRFTGFSRN